MTAKKCISLNVSNNEVNENELKIDKSEDI